MPQIPTTNLWVKVSTQSARSGWCRAAQVADAKVRAMAPRRARVFLAGIL